MKYIEKFISSEFVDFYPQDDDFFSNVRIFFLRFLFITFFWQSLKLSWADDFIMFQIQ